MTPTSTPMSQPTHEPTAALHDQMPRSPRSRRSTLLGLLCAGLVGGAACTGQVGGEDEAPTKPLTETPSPDGKSDDPTGNEPETVLDQRVIDYSEALRTASLKLLDVTPTLKQIYAVRDATEPEVAYETALDEMMADARFRRRMIRFWRDTLRQGGGGLDSAPVFAARVMVEGRPYGELFTAQSGTCPSYDGNAEAFVDGDCDNGVAVHAGVLTNPGSMAQFYGNMAFRRVRWVQEIFACNKFPAEVQEGVKVDGAVYTAPWPFDAVATAPIDFQDTSSVVCANCHATINRLAPLFANFDQDGMWQPTIQVETPTTPDPIPTELSHWLKPGEHTAWRKGVEVDDLPELGQALAEDEDVQACLVARLWNFAMSKEDIVSGMATVPESVIDAHVKELASHGDLEATLASILRSKDFVSF